MASLASYFGKEERPSVLMSFYYLPSIRRTGEEQFRKVKSFRCMLDSGAYTARTRKKTIDVDALTEEIRSGGWAEAAALDSIGDPEASYRNAELMAQKGVAAFPTFHFGEPWEYLRKYAAKWDKVGLGGLVPVKSASERNAWLEECFSRVWPKKTHGFGVMKEETLMKFPFHSADSSSWEVGALCFGNHQFADGQNLGLREPEMRDALKGGKTYLRPEIAWYMRLEKKVKARWAQEFRKQGWSE